MSYKDGKWNRSCQEVLGVPSCLKKMRFICENLTPDVIEIAQNRLDFAYQNVTLDSYSKDGDFNLKFKTPKKKGDEWKDNES